MFALLDVTILLVGIPISTALGLLLGIQARRAHRQASLLEERGITMPGAIESIQSTGRYNTYARVTVAVDNGSFVETVPSSVPVAERWEVGQSVPTQVVLGPPFKGRIERPVEASQHVFLGIAVAVFCSFLFLVLALVA